MGSVKINGKEYPTVMVGTVERFLANPIIRELLDAATEGRKMNLNDVARLYGNGACTLEQMHELYRLIGYPLSGFGEVFQGPETLIGDETSEDYKEESAQENR
jgi:hypothetical protein